MQAEKSAAPKRPRLTLKKLPAPNLSSFTPLEYGGAIVGWVGSRLPWYGSSCSLKAFIDGECFNINSEGFDPFNFGYPREFEEPLRNLYRAGFPFILNFPEGSVELSPSKSELVVSELTQATFVALMADFSLTFHHYAQKVINSQESHFEALSTAAIFLECPFLISSQFQWRSEAIPLRPLHNDERCVGHHFKAEGSMRQFYLRREAKEITDEINRFSAHPSTFCDHLQGDEHPIVIVVADGESEYEEAVLVIRQQALLYKAARVGNIKPLDIVLANSDEPLLKWFNGNQITLQEFKDACKESLVVPATQLRSFSHNAG